MILHIPHSGTELLGRNISQKDIDYLTDWYTDELFRHENSERVVQKVSRFVCDVERFPDDKEEMFKKGQGICYTKGTYNNNITVKDKEYIIENIYKEHHKKLNNITRKTLTIIPKVIIVDCHSFLSDISDPDICIGINDTLNKPDEKLIKDIVKYINKENLSCKINSPFSGAIIPSDFINNDKVQCIMIEVNKNLYLNETEKNDKFIKIQKIITNILDIISDYEIKEDI